MEKYVNLETFKDFDDKLFSAQNMTTITHLQTSPITTLKFILLLADALKSFDMEIIQHCSA